MPFQVEFRNVAGEAAAIGSAGPYTLVVDRPADAGGLGLGFNGGQLLYPAVSDPVSYEVELAGDASQASLEALVAHVDAIAEIPNSIRRGTEVSLARVAAVGARA